MLTAKDLQPGDVLVEKRNGLFGSFLQWVVGIWLDPKYQHVRVVYHLNKFGEVDRVIEDGEIIDPQSGTRFFGVGINPIPTDLGKYTVRRPLCAPSTNNAALTVMASRLGEPYGAYSLFAIWCRRFLGLPAPDGFGFFCSELVCWAWSVAGYDLVPDRPDHDSAPWDLATSDRLTTLQP